MKFYTFLFFIYYLRRQFRSILAFMLIFTLPIAAVAQSVGDLGNAVGNNSLASFLDKNQVWQVERIVPPNPKAGEALANSERLKIAASSKFSESEKKEKTEKWQKFFREKYSKPRIYRATVEIFINKKGDIYAIKKDTNNGDIEKYFYNEKGEFYRVLPDQRIVELADTAEDSLINFLPPIGLQFLYGKKPGETDKWVFSDVEFNGQKSITLLSGGKPLKVIHFGQASVNALSKMANYSITLFDSQGKIAYEEQWKLSSSGEFNPTSVSFELKIDPAYKLFYFNNGNPFQIDARSIAPK